MHLQALLGFECTQAFDNLVGVLSRARWVHLDVLVSLSKAHWEQDLLQQNEQKFTQAKITWTIKKNDSPSSELR